MRVCLYVHMCVCVCGLFMCPARDSWSDDKNWGIETGKYVLSGEKMQIHNELDFPSTTYLFTKVIENPNSFQAS